jgi:asparagine N-glycosylation enzyme membrane subunit Stt3
MQKDFKFSKLKVFLYTFALIISLFIDILGVIYMDYIYPSLILNIIYWLSCFIDLIIFIPLLKQINKLNENNLENENIKSKYNFNKTNIISSIFLIPFLIYILLLDFGFL